MDKKPEYKKPPPLSLVPDAAAAAKAKPGTAHIHHGGALQWLKTLPVGYASCMLTDPPYCSGGALPANKAASTQSKYFCKNSPADLPSFAGDSMDSRVFTHFMHDIFWEAARIMPQGVVFCFTDWRMYPTFYDAMQLAGLTPKGALVWHKRAGRTIPNNFSRLFEFVIYAHCGSVPEPEEPVHIKGVWEEYLSHKDKFHQTMKPPLLCRELLRLAPPGRVIDPFCGSGSSLLAAVQNGRNAAGSERDPFYHNMAKERLLADGFVVNQS